MKIVPRRSQDGPRRSQDAPKRPPRRPQDASRRILALFWGANLESEIDGNSKKWCSNACFSWARFLNDFSFFYSTYIPQEAVGASGLAYFCSPWYFCCPHLVSILSVSLASFFLQKTINIEEKSESKRSSTFASSWTPFLVEFSSFLAPCWASSRGQVGASWATRRAPDPGAICPESLLGAQSLPNRFLIDFGSMFDGFGIDV